MHSHERLSGNCVINKSEINDQDPEAYGCKWDCETKSMVPVWYIGPQLPRHLKKCERNCESHLITVNPKQAGFFANWYVISV